ncbi:uncharacterized protein H6S33_010226 [Morchella sextelata]|uniref:uncharacterized protein n=1 Tax=Morchella sextelata TaxID=1174677 RepID=UPI001D03B3AD|nr:uncharacterized protein H6S33_010226 [Morchella sextelata]KAH0612174.1 hypothetical protein H6S33_010226 [Morchella sextelata]
MSSFCGLNGSPPTAFDDISIIGMPFGEKISQYKIEELPAPGGPTPSSNRRKGSGTRFFSRKKFTMPSLFESLPIEIVNNMTRYLPDGLEIINLRKVSRTFYNIFSCHDLVSRALVQHYPYSRESQLPHLQRTKAVYDRVARRSYTQPRRKYPSRKEYVDCSPIFCDDEEEVLVYRTAEQILTKGWAGWLWDMRDDKKVEVKLVDGAAKVGGCYNENGELYESAVVRDVSCWSGRGVMVLHGHHIHHKFANDKDARRGEYTGVELALGNFGIQIAPRRMKHAHTFIQIYSLQRSNFGQLISSFSFCGNTVLAHATCNKRRQQLNGDDLRILEWRFESDIKPIYRDPEEGEEVRLTWVGSYGLNGTREYRVGLDELDEAGIFKGDESPVMVEWKIDTLNTHLQPDGAFESSKPTLFYAPTEFNKGGVLGLPEQTIGWDELRTKNDAVKWPVAVSPYRSFNQPEPKMSVLRWGARSGVNGYYTTDPSEMVIDYRKTVTLWYDRSWNPKLEGHIVTRGTLISPRWRSVLDNMCESTGVGFKAENADETAAKLLMSRKETARATQRRRERERQKRGPVDNAFFHEGSGWILYLLRAEREDWRKEEERKKRMQENRAQCGLETNLRELLVSDGSEEEAYFTGPLSESTSVLVYLRF